MAKFDFTVSEKKPGTLLAMVRGDLNGDTVHLFNHSMQSLPIEAKTIFVDLSEIDEISSAGIGAIVARCTELLHQEVNVAIVNAAPKVARLLHFTGLDSILEKK